MNPSGRESSEREEIVQFKLDIATRVFDSPLDFFIEDYMLKKYIAEKSGWRTLAEIASRTRISHSALYGKHSTIGTSLDEPIRRGLIETRIFPGERGRGGEVLRLRIAYDKEPIRELVHKKILQGSVKKKGEELAQQAPFELKKAQFLLETPILATVSREKIADIAKMAEKVSFPPNEFMIHEGDVSYGFFLIMEGQVEVRQRGKVLRRMGRGQFFGETTLAENETRSADIFAVEPIMCLKLTSTQLKDLIKYEPQIGIKIIEEMVKRNRGVTKEGIDQ
ncbi:MAG TPA: cyclic nucleotide-binding domain-containing protein [Nitrososphaerales archaeon]|nr:cyclic nucleotide-binding domain-containing protein [Nitrososphaerales archaeon]